MQHMYVQHVYMLPVHMLAGHLQPRKPSRTWCMGRDTHLLCMYRCRALHRHVSHLCEDVGTRAGLRSSFRGREWEE